MKQKNKVKNSKLPKIIRTPPTAFELLMNYWCDMHAEMKIAPPVHWEKTRTTPKWVKNIYGNFRRTLLRPLVKLKPRRKLNWRYYGRIIGILERFKKFYTHDIPKILEDEGFDKISDREWARIEPLLGLDRLHDYFLTLLKFPADSIIPTERLVAMAQHKALVNLERIKQRALGHVSHQDPKTTELFWKGISEGYTAVLNSDGEFSADDRRADIHFELLAMQYEVEKLRRVLPPKNNKHLVAELRKNPEFKNQTDDWFKDVFKKVKLSIGRRGRPTAYSQA
jgi:hypothetical protein